MSSIYFFQVQENGIAGLVKIGFSSSVKTRLAAIRNSSPTKSIHCLGVIDGEEAEEKQLHLRFAADRRHGEWFAPSDALLTFIRSASTPLEPPKPRVRHKIEREPKKVVNIRIGETLLGQIKAFALANNRSLNGQIVQALKAWVDKPLGGQIVSPVADSTVLVRWQKVFSLCTTLHDITKVAGQVHALNNEAVLAAYHARIAELR